MLCVLRLIIERSGFQVSGSLIIKQEDPIQKLGMVSHFCDKLIQAARNCTRKDKAGGDERCTVCKSFEPYQVLAGDLCSTISGLA